MIYDLVHALSEVHASLTNSLICEDRHYLVAPSDCRCLRRRFFGCVGLSFDVLCQSFHIFGVIIDHPDSPLFRQVDLSDFRPLVPICFVASGTFSYDPVHRR